MKIHIFFLAILLCVNNCYAQNETNNWLFGNHVWLDFSSGNPVPQAGSAMSIIEGCATFSDTSGNLLFYTKGDTVWDRNHNVMPNGTGLNGDPSSTQSAIIVPKPGSNYTIFYIFTVDVLDTTPSTIPHNGLQYSEVDMTLNGGMGDVTAVKNVQLVIPTCEKLTAVRHGLNPQEFWVITHEWNSARFFAFHVSSAGVNATPVVTNMGIVHLQSTGTAPYQASHGYMKASPDGSKLALAIVNPVNAVQIVDFNNVTGAISNSIAMTGIRDPYGVEFSPSGRYLYVALSSNPDTIFQWDMQAANIPASKTIAGVTPPNMIITALQLAKNGKIYCGQFTQNFLAVINDPEQPGLACNFVTNAVALPTQCFQGLPNFFVSLFINADYTYSDTCYNDNTQFTLQYTLTADSVHWNFDDPASGAANTSTQINPVHVFSAPGNYNVSCIVYDLGTMDTVVKTITIVSPFVNLGPPGSLCDGQQAWISHGNNAADSSHWFNGVLNSDSILYTGPSLNAVNILWVDVYQYGCVIRDSITITSYIYPSVNLGVDTTVCANSYTLDANAGNIPGYTYLWQDLSTADTLQISTQGGPTSYYVEVSNNGCITYDTINVTLSTPVNISLGSNNINICAGDSITLTETSGTVFNSYLWSTTATTSTITTGSAGFYWLQVVLNGCVASDTVEVTVNPGPVGNNVLGNDTAVCASSYLLNANPNNIPGLTFIWQDGSTNPTFNANTSNIYYVDVSDGSACHTLDTFSLILGTPIDISLGNDTSICDGIGVTLHDTSGTTFANYFWSTGSTAASINVIVAATYTVTVSENGCNDTDEIVVISSSSPTVNLGDSAVYCIGDQIVLDAGSSGATYLWNDGSTTQTIIASYLSGDYYVEVTLNGCTGSDTVHLTFNPSPTIFPSTDTVICEGAQVFLDITNPNPGFTFQWSDNYPDPYRFISDEGTYTATVSIGNCTKTASYTISKLDIPVVYLGEDTVLCIGTIWKLDATSPLATYIWQDGSTEPTYSTNYAATFGVQVTNQCGIDVDSIKLEFTECNCFVAFPNAFTPNHDLKNDFFNFKFDCLAFESTLKIYNRWGMLMFETTDPEKSWDGTFEGEEAVPDVYVYYLKYKGVDGSTFIEKKERGTFLLYR